MAGRIPSPRTACLPVVRVPDHEHVPGKPAREFLPGDVRILGGGVLMTVRSVEVVGDRIRMTLGDTFGHREVTLHRPRALLAHVADGR